MTLNKELLQYRSLCDVCNINVFHTYKELETMINNYRMINSQKRLNFKFIYKNEIMKKKTVTIISAGFNEEPNVSKFFNKIKSLKINSNISINFILVDDGSVDNTWNEMKKISKNPKQIMVKKMLKKFFFRFNPYFNLYLDYYYKFI